jgi:tRNA (pseudouridine54-N1)-methyltransferase
MRRDTNIFVVLNGPPRAPVTIEFNGEALKRLSPDERSSGAWIQKVLAGRIDKEWSNPFEGIRVSAKSFQDIIRELADAGRPIYMLHENGTPLSGMRIDKDPVLVLGDHIGLSLNDEKFVLRYAKGRISLGKPSYLASSCISVMNWFLDQNTL